MTSIRKVITNPMYYTSILSALIRGSLYIVYFSIFRKNVSIKFPFLVSARVSITGPGKVEIGSRCVVVENVFKGLTIVTTSKDSQVKVGNNCMLAGLTIRCSGRVNIGDHVMTAVSLIQDTLFVNGNRASTIVPSYRHEPKPVIVGDNAWIGGHCTLLSGCDMGAHSVMAAYSVCMNETVKEFSLMNGNPVRKSLPIEQLLKLRNLT